MTKQAAAKAPGSSPLRRRISAEDFKKGHRIVSRLASRIHQPGTYPVQPANQSRPVNPIKAACVMAKAKLTMTMPPTM